MENGKEENRRKEATPGSPGDKGDSPDRRNAGGTGTGAVPECRQEVSSKTKNQEIGFW